MRRRRRWIPGALLLALTAGLAERPCDGDSGDDRAAWLAKHAVSVRTIDPADEAFADLMPLVDQIGDTRVVALGEQTHGDGATFHAKVRLVKFLHQVMGFDVLVWESGMYDCRAVDAAFRRGEDIDEAIGHGIFPIWGRSAQVRPLLEYVQATQSGIRPLVTAGMDCQLTGRGTAARLAAHVESLLDRAGETPLIGTEQRTALMDGFGRLSEGDRGVDEEAHADFQDAVRALIARIECGDEPSPRVAGPRELSLIARALRNVAAFEEMMHWYGMGNAGRGTQANQMKAALAREPAMAETLIWLAREHYADRKLIVWAASSHLTYNSRSVEMRDESGDWKYDTEPWEPMGNAVRIALGDDLYVIDFIAHGGEMGNVFRPASYPLPPPEEGSIDELCHRSGVPLMFIDFRRLPNADGGQWLHERLVARPRGYGPMRTVWPKVCDAMFFVDVMYPSTPVE